MPKHDDPTELLAELATLDEVSAWIPTGSDHINGITPPWCELVLEANRADDGTLTPAWPLNVRMPLRRHDGELLIEVLHSVLHPDANRMILDALWDRLDAVVERIQKRVNKGKDPMRADVGEALGLATSIAVINNPVEPDVDEVRGVAMERFDIRHGISGE